MAGREQAANLAVTATIWRESNPHIALCPEFDVASQAAAAGQARVNLQEARGLFFEHASPEERKSRRRPPTG